MKKNIHGFPLTTCGNDRAVIPAICWQGSNKKAIYEFPAYPPKADGNDICLCRALICMLLPALAACSGGGPPPSASGVSLFSGFSVSETLSNSRKWRLDAATAGMEDSGGRMVFSGPELQFYDNDRVSSVIKARTGLLEPSKKSAVLSADVSVNAKKDGMLLKTDKLYYSSERNKIWTDEKVTLVRGKTVITGKGFTANPDLSEIEIEHQETRIRK